MRQPQFAPLPLAEQVALLVAVSAGVLDDVAVDRVDGFRAALHDWLADHRPDGLTLDDQTAALSPEVTSLLVSGLKALAQSFAALPAGEA